VVVCLAATGCNPNERAQDMPLQSQRDLQEPPLHVAGTVAQYAVLVGGGYMSLQGYGVVVGLGNNGSSEVPEHLKQYLLEYMTKQDLGLWSKGTESLPPEVLLRDKDTTVVLLGAAVPPGAPAGSRFDVEIAAFPQTDTRSLDGGMLMPSEMRLAWLGRAQPGGPSFVWARAAGPVFVNPFLNFSDPADLVETRRGRIIGGGRLLRSRPIKMQLFQPDYHRSRQIGDRINERFSRPGSPKIARPMDAFTVRIAIPPRWKNQYERFLSLVMHLPLVVSGVEWETHVRRLAGALESRTARHEDIALVLEAAGQQVLPVIKPYYESKDQFAAFYAARTGLRLGDNSAASVILRLAEDSSSPLQLTAIEELGLHPQLLRAVPVLRRLLDDQNELVRVAAYKALLQHGDNSAIRRYDIAGQFELDVVSSKGPRRIRRESFCSGRT